MKPGGNAGGLIATDVLAFVLGTVGLALRLYTRKILLNQIGIDDCMAIISWAGLIALIVQNLHNISTGLGSHFAAIPPSGLTAFSKDLWLGLVIYQITLLFTKLTLFFQFYRVIQPTNWRRLKIFNLVVMSIIGGWQIAQVLVQVFACIPVQASWDKTIPGNCQSITVTRTMNSVANIITDFIILLLPIPIVWNLSLPRNQKIALTGIFGLGFFTCIVSILRVTTTPVIESDFAWETVSVIAWTTAEVLTGTIIANISTLRPLVGRYVRAWATRATKESSYQLDYLPSHSQKTPGTSAADRRSGLICPPRRLTGGGWLDLSESDDQVPGVRTLEPVCLDEGRGHSRGSIRVTKEWSVDA